MKALNGSLVVEVILEVYTRTHVEEEEGVVVVLHPLQAVAVDLRLLEDKIPLVMELELPDGHTLEEEASACIFVSVMVAGENECDNLALEFQQAVAVVEERVCIFALEAVAEDKFDSFVVEPVLLAAAEEESKLDNFAQEPLLIVLAVVLRV